MKPHKPNPPKRPSPTKAKIRKIDTQDIRRIELGLPKSYTGYVTSLSPNDERVQKYLHMYNEEGFDPTETWDFFTSIAKFILPRLKYFSENVNSYPSWTTIDEWKKILNEMVIAFTLILEDELYNKDDLRVVKIQLGLDHFRKYYFDLWD